MLEIYNKFLDSYNNVYISNYVCKYKDHIFNYIAFVLRFYTNNNNINNNFLIIKI